jgi:hypothetical protein
MKDIQRVVELDEDYYKCNSNILVKIRDERKEMSNPLHHKVVVVVSLMLLNASTDAKTI